MSSFLSKFYIKLIILAALVAIGGSMAFQFLPWQQPRVFYFVVAFFFILTAIFHWWLTGVLRKNIRRFPAYFMGATTIKLFASLIFIVAYAVKNPQEAKPFLLSFFLIYLIFTAFETVEILSHSSRIKKDH